MTPLMGSETLTWFAWGAPRLLFVLGLGFLVANIKVAADLMRVTAVGGARRC